MEQQKTSNSYVEKENQSRRHHNPRLQPLLQSCNHQDSMVLEQKQTHRLNRIDTDTQNRIENPELGPQMYGQLIFDKAGKSIQWKKRQSLDSDMQKNETRPLSYRIHKNKFKMDERPQCETGNHQNLRGESRQKPLQPHLQKFIT